MLQSVLLSFAVLSTVTAQFGYFHGPAFHNNPYHGPPTGGYNGGYNPYGPPRNTYSPYGAPQRPQHFNINNFVNRIIHQNTAGFDDKILSRHSGQSVSGGTAQGRKFRSMSECEHACAATPTCFAGDYNSWSRQCYFHSSGTACNTMGVQKSTTHFKKLVCQPPNATPNAVVSAGMSLSGGIEVTKVKSLLDCIKRCRTTGQGLGVTCFGLDWDQGDKRCYLHTNQANTCTAPVALRADADVTHYAYCP